MSHQQDVLLPRVPLLLVDRGRRTRKSKDCPGNGTIAPYGQETSADSTQMAQESGISWDKIAVSIISTTGRTQVIEQKSCDINNGADAILLQPSQDPLKLDTGVPFQFINAIGTHHLKRPDLRKLVKSHVKKRSNREKRKRGATQGCVGHVAATQAQTKLDSARIEAQGRVASSSVCAGSTTPYYGHGNISFTITPELHSLLDYCALLNILNGMA